MNYEFKSKIVSLTSSSFPKSMTMKKIFPKWRKKGYFLYWNILGLKSFFKIPLKNDKNSYHSMSFSTMLLQHFLQMGRLLFL